MSYIVFVMLFIFPFTCYLRTALDPVSSLSVVYCKALTIGAVLLEAALHAARGRDLAARARAVAYAARALLARAVCARAPRRRLRPQVHLAYRTNNSLLMR